MADPDIQAALAEAASDPDIRDALHGREPKPRRVFTGKEEREEEDKKLIESMGPTRRFLVGAGAGLSNVFKNVADIASPVLPDALVPDKQKWAEERELVAPVTDTTAGMIGEFVGETAPTLPLGLGAEHLAAKTVGRILPKALGLAKNVPRFLGGAAPGYVMGGPEHREEGAYAGGALNVALPYGGRLLRKAWRGVVKPSAAAKALMDAGVEDISIGQMAPRNILAGFEEAGQSGPAGQVIKDLREKPVESFRKAIVNKGLAPGAKKVASAADPNAAIAEAYKGFRPAYDVVRHEPVNISGLGKSLARAADDPGIVATPEEIAGAQRFLGQQAGLLERAAPEVTDFATMAKPAPKSAPIPPIPKRPPLRVVTPIKEAVEEGTKKAEKWQLPNQKSSGAKPLGALPKALKKQGGIEPTLVPDPTDMRPPVLGPLPRMKVPPSRAAPTSAGRGSAAVSAVAEEAADPAAAKAAEKVGRAEAAAARKEAIAEAGETMGRPPRLHGELTADPVLQARENIRKEMFRLRKEGKHTLADLLESGEDVLSKRLADELPESASKSLKATDAQYRLHKIISDAVGRGGDTGFRPSHLSAAIKKATEKGAYERGAGGELRELASHGREVFDTRHPATGARMIMSIPFLGKSIGNAMSMGTVLANQPTIRKALVGRLGIQRGAAAVENLLERSGLLKAGRLSMATPDPAKMDSAKYEQQARQKARIEALRRRYQESRNGP